MTALLMCSIKIPSGNTIVTLETNRIGKVRKTKGRIHLFDEELVNE